MPVIPTKQSPPKPTSPNGTISAAKPGNFLSRLKPVSQIVDETMSVLIYGRNRIGKSRLASEFPKPMVYLSLEPSKTGGAKSLPKVPGLEVEVVQNSVDLMGFANDLTNEKHGFKTVVLDSASSMEKFILQEVMGWDEPAEQLRVGKSSPVQTEHYTDRSERMKKLVRPFLNLNMNCVILANEKDHNPPSNEGGVRKSSFSRGMQQESYFAADTGAGMARWLMDSCDYILQMLMDAEVKTEMVEMIAGQPKRAVETPTGKLIRRLRLGYHPNYAAGGRSDRALPDFIDGEVDPKTGMNSKSLYENFIKAIR